MFLFFMLLMLSAPAYAYIDASVGSMLVQGLVALLMFVPFYFRRIVHFFKSKKVENEDDE